MPEQAVIFYTHGNLVWSNWFEITQGVRGTAKGWSKVSRQAAPSTSNTWSRGRQDQHLLHKDLNTTCKCSRQVTEGGCRWWRLLGPKHFCNFTKSEDNSDSSLHNPSCAIYPPCHQMSNEVNISLVLPPIKRLLVDVGEQAETHKKGMC